MYMEENHNLCCHLVLVQIYLVDIKGLDNYCAFCLFSRGVSAVGIKFRERLILFTCML